MVFDDTKQGCVLWQSMYDVTYIILQRTHREVWNDDMRIITFFLPSKYDFSFLETEFFVCLLFLTAREWRKKHGFRLLECLPRGAGAAGRRRMKQKDLLFLRLFIHSSIPTMYIESLLCA